MNPPNIKRAQKEVHKIMVEMGKTPTHFDPKPAPKPRRFSAGQVAGLLFLIVVFLMVWGLLISWLLDMHNRGAF